MRVWYWPWVRPQCPDKMDDRTCEAAGGVAGALGDGNEPSYPAPPGRIAGAFTAIAGSRNLSSLATVATALLAADCDQALDALMTAVHRHTGGHCHDDMALLLSGTRCVPAQQRQRARAGGCQDVSVPAESSPA